jgi:hypothetical protein
MKNIPWKKYLLWAVIALTAVLVLLYAGWRNTGRGRAILRLNRTASQQNNMQLQCISGPGLFIKFYYNSDGSLYKEMSYRYAGVDHSEVYTREYSYENDTSGGKIVTVKTLDCRTGKYLDAVTVRKVDQNGQCCEQTESDGVRNVMTSFRYDEGRVTNIVTTYDADPSEENEDLRYITQQFDWDFKGRLAKHVMFNADGKTETTYIRNLRGDVTRIRWVHTALDGTQSQGRQSYQWKYAYTIKWPDRLDKVTDGETRMNFEWSEDCLVWVQSQYTDLSMWPSLLNKYPWLFRYGNPSQEWLTIWQQKGKVGTK